MMKQNFFLLMWLLLTGSPAYSLEWENFISRSLREAPEIKALRFEYEVLNDNEKEYANQLNWSMTVDIGRERDRQISLTNQNFDLEESELYSVNLQKSFLTGTDITFDLRSDKLDSTATFLAAPKDGHFHSYLLTVEQNLWGNAFGAGIRDGLRGAQLSTEIRKLESAEQIESALLAGADLYWQAVLSYRKLIESEAALKRYEGLVSNVERKARVRYAAPAELAQVRAEYLTRQRTAKVNRIDFEQKMADLKIFLPSVGEGGILLQKSKFQQIDQIKIRPIPIEKTRTYLLAELKKKQSELNADSIESLNKPQLAFVGQVGATGVNTSTSESQEQLIEGRRPYMYLGVRWSHTFGEDVQQTRVRKAKAEALAQKIRTDLVSQKVSERLSVLEKSINILEANLKVQEELLDSRRAAVRELTRTFNQGRTDISILIEAINRAEEAEVEQVRVRADLEIAFLQWQTLTDQLSLE